MFHRFDFVTHSLFIIYSLLQLMEENDCYVIVVIDGIFFVLGYIEQCREHLYLILYPYNKIIYLVNNFIIKLRINYVRLLFKQFYYYK